jgi:hypothetical protein
MDGANRYSEIGNNWEQRAPKYIVLHEGNSKHSTSNKIIINKATLKSLWTYGIQIWVMASNSNVDNLHSHRRRNIKS